MFYLITFVYFFVIYCCYSVVLPFFARPPLYLVGKEKKWKWKALLPLTHYHHEVPLSKATPIAPVELLSSQL